MNKQLQGRSNFHDGAAAEETVARYLELRGATAVAKRWRGSAGEIDLIYSDAGGLVFVEVKKARTWAEAALRLLPVQLGRITAAAEEYVAKNLPGQLVDMRVDVALVDQHGAVQIRENVTF